MAMAMGIRGMVVSVLLAVLFVQVVDSVDFAGGSRIVWKAGRRASLEDSMNLLVDGPTRRLLATTYVTYGALNGNRSPCPSAGRSYYNNCGNTGAVSPYRRSCTQITRCARG